jgi:hypothetical protein
MFPFTPHTTLRLDFGSGGFLFDSSLGDPTHNFDLDLGLASALKPGPAAQTF